MKHIVKGTEPHSLTEYKATPGAVFDNCPKEDIRRQLLEEQKYLCAYCMSRISDEWDERLQKFKIEIEHYLPQYIYNGSRGKPDHRLNYNNMLGVCHGNAGKPRKRLRCDKSKDASLNEAIYPLRLDPRSVDCENMIRYQHDGIMTSGDGQAEREINEVFNLNEDGLIEERKLIIDTIDEILWKKGKSIAEINRLLHRWETANHGKYEPYCQTAIYYLKKLHSIVTRRRKEH